MTNIIEYPDDRNFLYNDEVEEFERQRDEEHQKEIEDELFRD